MQHVGRRRISPCCRQIHFYGLFFFFFFSRRRPLSAGNNKERKKVEGSLEGDGALCGEQIAVAL